MKLLFDLFPIILFFVAYKLVDIYVATAVAIAASVVQIGWMLLRGHKIESMQWTSLLIIVLFGGLTLLLQDEMFIKWKPTILYGLFAAVLAGARLGFGKNLIRSAMQAQISLPEPVWTRLTWLWSGFFAVLGVLNLYVVYWFSTDTWVNFKLFGTTGLTLAFVLAQAFYIGRHVQEEQS